MLVIRQIRKGPRNCNWVLATLITWNKEIQNNGWCRSLTRVGSRKKN